MTEKYPARRFKKGDLVFHSSLNYIAEVKFNSNRDKICVDVIASNTQLGFIKVQESMSYFALIKPLNLPAYYKFLYKSSRYFELIRKTYPETMFTEKGP